MSSPSDNSALDSHQQTWLSTALGRYLQIQEQGLYDLAVVDLFGFNALQIGCLQMDLLRNSRVTHRYQSDNCYDGKQQPNLLCKDDFLPIADTSLDLLLLPHRLEFSERPHQTLREAERVIMPEGHLLISGFNPFGWWGLCYFFKKCFTRKHHPKTLNGYYPWSGNFISLNRLKDWLALLGFEVLSVQMACHVPPFENQRWHRRFHFMQRLGMRWLPLLGGVYFIVAKKRVACMTPLKPNWKTSSLTAGLVVSPTQRKHTQRGVQKNKDS